MQVRPRAMRKPWNPDLLRYVLVLAFSILALLGTSADALNLTAVQLRKAHGTAGVLDTPVDRNQTIAGALTVEARAIGAGHQVVFQFDATVTSPGTAEVTDESGTTVGMATPVINSTEVVVTLVGVPDNKRITVRLANVNGQGVDVAAAVGFLTGDVNGSRNVNAADTSAVKARAGQAAGAANAMYDLNASGAITAGDISAVKARNNRALPVAFTIGGSVAGLAGVVVLQNNGAGSLSLSANGPFVFPAAVSGAFNVTVITQPAGQLCTIVGGAGTVTSASVANITVTCVSALATTIYDIKNGLVPAGALVRLDNALVTGKKTGTGYFLQVPSGDTGYAGTANSGIFVATTATAPSFVVGNRVNVVGSVAVAQGAMQIIASSTSVAGGNIEMMPTPVAVASPADIASGGIMAAALESVLVAVSNATVTAQDAVNGEFTVTGGLVVDDLLFAVSPLPSIGTVYQSMSGIVASIGGTNKLLPAIAGDLIEQPAVTATISPPGMFIRVGDVNAPTFPASLVLSLSAPTASNTFVPVSSSSGSLLVQGGGVTILAGTNSATVLLTGLAQASSVTLTATFGVQVLTTTVRVLGVAELPALASLTPAVVTIPAGGTTGFSLTLDIPAPPGGTVVSLALNPANAGIVPATVTIPANALSASFSYVDSATQSSVQLDATLAATTLSATITPAVPAAIVINEVDYDQVGTDAAEFIELYNGSASSISLANLSLVLVNGTTNTAYQTISLASAGSLAPGQYLVVGATPVIVALPVGVLGIAFALAQDNIQNGAPDGIALVDSSTNTLIDSLSYEGSMTAVTLGAIPGTFNLVRGAPTLVADSNTLAGSLCRMPNGARTNDDATDWAFCATPTPGAANGP